jgi:hypothetical protein
MRDGALASKCKNTAAHAVPLRNIGMHGLGVETQKGIRK